MNCTDLSDCSHQHSTYPERMVRAASRTAIPLGGCGGASPAGARAGRLRRGRDARTTIPHAPLEAGTPYSEASPRSKTVSTQYHCSRTPQPFVEGWTVSGWRLLLISHSRVRTVGSPPNCRMLWFQTRKVTNNKTTSSTCSPSCTSCNTPDCW
jgi:hypothetical protein